MHDDADALGVARAGAAFAARREELGISQRQLAAMKIIGAPNLIAFEKGRSWPREKTLAKLEQVVGWPPGTLAKVRAGGGVNVSGATGTRQPESEAAAVVTGCSGLIRGAGWTGCCCANWMEGSSRWAIRASVSSTLAKASVRETSSN